MARLSSGPRTMSAQRDIAGHRTYKIKFLVETDLITDGPAAALACPGLPVAGQAWNFGTDFDVWAYCTQESDVSIHEEREGDATTIWAVVRTFTTKPTDRCREDQFDDPLLQPPKITISSVRYTEEARFDQYGDPILTSSLEAIRGPQVEVDRNRLKVHIEQNVPTFALAFSLPASMMNHVNQGVLWGLDPRKIKLSDMNMQKRFRGECEPYYTRALDFDVDASDLGFDRSILDEGTKVLHGHWGADGTWTLDNIAGNSPNPFNPQHFDQYKDKNGENARVVLDGSGKPAGAPIVNSQVTILAEGVLTDGDQDRTGSISGQPTEAQYLVVIVTDADESIFDGFLTITGLDEHGLTISEDFNLFVGTSRIRSNQKFTDVTSITQTNVDGTGPGAADKLEVIAEATTSAAGSIFAQFYPEADFTQLQIPLTF